MDPYAVVEYRGQKFQTLPHKSAGMTPVWNQVFYFSINNLLQLFSFPINSLNDEIAISVMDHNLLKDGLVSKYYQMPFN